MRTLSPHEPSKRTPSWYFDNTHPPYTHENFPSHMCPLGEESHTTPALNGTVSFKQVNPNINMPLVYRILHFLFIHHRPTAREQATAQVVKEIKRRQREHRANLNKSLRTIVRELRGDDFAVWTCHCCQFRNDVMVIDGEHPLGVLKCEYCAHVYCLSCTHTTPLCRWSTEGNFKSQDNDARNFRGRRLPYVSVCSSCGLTWRAKVTGARRVKWGFGRRDCVCGCKPSVVKPWAGFKIKEGEGVDQNTRALLRTLKEELADR